MNNSETSQSEPYLEGITDGSHGFPFPLKNIHNRSYMLGYLEGLKKWCDELYQREQKNLEASVFEF